MWDVPQQEGLTVYFIIVTLSCLVGQLLPTAVSALLPIVLLPLVGLLGADHVAAEYMSEKVLMSSLLFIIAIVSDETTVFQRLCLRAIGRHSLRMQPLFFLLQLSALMLSTLVPSSIIVIFYTVVIERFVATVEEE
ncbi:unnamed protein product, partial [Ixodes persulcatus]